MIEAIPSDTHLESGFLLLKEDFIDSQLESVRIFYRCRKVLGVISLADFGCTYSAWMWP
ncbi:hypothetical protein ACS0TY_006033 [Phlomoides rotata]